MTSEKRAQKFHTDDASSTQIWVEADRLLDRLPDKRVDKLPGKRLDKRPD